MRDGDNHRDYSNYNSSKEEEEENRRHVDNDDESMTRSPIYRERGNIVDNDELAISES